MHKGFYQSSKDCNLSNICGDETLSKMDLVCPNVQDLYFLKLKFCYNNNYCLFFSFHTCDPSVIIIYHYFPKWLEFVVNKSHLWKTNHVCQVLFDFTR